MTYNAQREERLRRLGIEQLPPLTACSSNDSDSDTRSTYSLITEINSLKINISGIRERPVPGRKCPNCYARGQTVWVIPGKRCPQCGTEVA